MNYNVIMNGIEVNAHYSEKSIDEVFLPLLARLSGMQRKKGRRILVFLAAPPGAGKSTLASFLQKLSEENENLTDIQAIGMDGFHRRQEYLLTHNTIRDGKEIRMVDIKGAPETFDLEALKQRIELVLQGGVVGWPTYDRHLHNPVDNAITVDKDIVLLEGNYLLLKEEGWCNLQKLADYTIFISANEKMLRERLLDRKIKSGNSAEVAEKFVDFSDMANVKICLFNSQGADLTLILGENDEYRISETGDVHG